MKIFLAWWSHLHRRDFGQDKISRGKFEGLDKFEENNAQYFRGKLPDALVKTLESHLLKKNSWLIRLKNSVSII